MNRTSRGHTALGEPVGAPQVRAYAPRAPYPSGPKRVGTRLTPLRYPAAGGRFGAPFPDARTGNRRRDFRALRTGARPRPPSGRGSVRRAFRASPVARVLGRPWPAQTHPTQPAPDAATDCLRHPASGERGERRKEHGSPAHRRIRSRDRPHRGPRDGAPGPRAAVPAARAAPAGRSNPPRRGSGKASRSSSSPRRARAGVRGCAGSAARRPPAGMRCRACGRSRR